MPFRLPALPALPTLPAVTARPSLAGVKDLSFKVISAVHGQLFTASRGRLGGRVGGMAALLLTTTGRRSGLEHSAMLTSPVQDGETLVLVASYGGDDRHPAWFLNLRENPDVTVVIDGETRPMRARTATPAERAELWLRVTDAYRGYAAYQRRTAREIPLVILEPAGRGARPASSAPPGGRRRR